MKKDNEQKQKFGL